MSQGQGLKSTWGVVDPAKAASDPQAKAFNQSFNTIIGPMRGHVEYMSVYGPLQQCTSMDGKCESLYQAYQKVAKTIDPANEAKAKPSIEKVIASAKETLAKHKATVAQTKADQAAWDAKEPLYAKTMDRISELEAWDDSAAGFLQALGDIDTKANERCWSEAIKGLDKLAAEVDPAYALYLKQKEAMAAYDQERPAFDAAFDAAQAHPLPSAEMTGLADQIANQLPAIDACVEQKDYVSAVDQLTALGSPLKELQDALARHEEREQEYNTRLDALQPRLLESEVCEFPTLAPMHEEIESFHSQMETAAGTGDFETALGHLDDLETRVDGYLRALEEERAKRDAFEQRADDLAGRVPDECRFGVLEPLQNDMQAALEAARAAATEGEFDAAEGQLDTLEQNIGSFETELAALEAKQAEYETGLAALQPRLSETEICEFPSMASLHETVASLQGEMEGFAADGDYDRAITCLGDLEIKVDEFFLALEEERERQRRREEIEQRIQEYEARIPQECRFPTLVPVQQDLVDLVGQARDALAADDLDGAEMILNDLELKFGEFEAEYAALEAKQTEYESRLAAIQPGLADASDSVFPSLTGLLEEVVALRDCMAEAASAGEYDVALDHLTDLEIKLAEYLALLDEEREKERRREAFEQRYEELVARLPNECRFQTLKLLVDKMEELKGVARSAADVEDFDRADVHLEDLATTIDEYETRYDELEKRQAEYETRLPGVIQRFDAIVDCEYSELADSQQRMDPLRSEMETAAADGNFSHAVDLLCDLEALLTEIEETRVELDEKRADYDARLPGLTDRKSPFDTVEFTELEEPVDKMKQDWSAMEAAAGGTDFRLAVKLMDTLEPQLDDLEKRLAELKALRDRYESALQDLASSLADVEGCDHALLADKKKEILDLRDEMVALAEATDFEAALEKVEPLKEKIAAFAKLEELREEYERRHELVAPRVEAAKAITYKSLADDVKEVTDLYGKMTAEAAKAELETALEKMGELEDKLEELEADNERLKTDEIRYNDRHGILEPKVKIAEDNKAEDAKSEAEAVTDKYEEMTDEAEEHEFTKAIEKADELAELIEAYEKKLEEIGDLQERYEALKPMVETRMKTAEATEFETLKGDLDDLRDLKEAMEGAADDDDYKSALEKLDELQSALDEFEKKALALHDAQTDYESRSGPVVERFNNLPKDARDKAEDAVEDAEQYKEEMEEMAGEEDFEGAVSALDRLIKALDEVDEKLKSDDELKAQYDGRLDSLQPRLDKVAGSKWADKLSAEKDAVDKAVAEMEKIAGRDDFKGALDAADAVDEALGKFDEAEDKLEQQQVRFDERIQGVQSRYDKAMKVTLNELSDKKKNLTSLKKTAEETAKTGDFDKALNEADDYAKAVDEFLEEADKLEDEQAREEDGGKPGSGGGGDPTGTDRVRDGIETIVDGAGEIIEGVGEAATQVGDSIQNAGEDAVNALEKDRDGVMAEMGEAVLQTAAELIDPVGDAVGSIISDSGTIVDNVGEAIGNVVDGEIIDAVVNVYEAGKGAKDLSFDVGAAAKEAFVDNIPDVAEQVFDGVVEVGGEAFDALTGDGKKDVEEGVEEGIKEGVK